MKQLVIVGLLAALVGCEDPPPPPPPPQSVAPVEKEAAPPRAYFDLRGDARDAYKAKKWADCVQMYKQAAAKTLFTSNRRGDLYNAACCAAAESPDDAFALLEEAGAAGYTDVEHMSADRDLEGLHSDPRWEPLKKKLGDAHLKKQSTWNAELAAIFAADQADRHGGMAVGVFERDKERRAAVAAIIDAGGAKVADDYYHAAMVFQHGSDIADIERAHDLANQAVELDPKNGQAAWLAAASLDRALMKKGEPQRYATQYMLDPKTDKWSLHPWDPAMTDSNREAVNVPPLSQAQAKVEQMNAVRNPGTP